MKENTKFINEISNKFYEMRVNYGIGYVLRNSKEIVIHNCGYNLNNKEFLECYELAFNKFKKKYEPRYLRELEDKIFQTLVGYKGSYGLDYVLDYLDTLEEKILKYEVDSLEVRNVYLAAVLKFKNKYKEEIYGNDDRIEEKKEKRTIWGLSPFKAFLAVICGIIDGATRRK